MSAELVLQELINAVGVGNKAYLTYAEMVADSANIPADSKVTVTNDSTESNNGDWQWDGAAFTKSAYDPLTQSNARMDANPLFNPVALTTKNIKTITKTGRYTVASKNNVTTSNGYPDDQWR